jgi:hypothetical protein
MVGVIYRLGDVASARWRSGWVVGSWWRPSCCWARSSFASFRLLALGVVSDRNRGMGLVALAVSALGTFAMMPTLPYELQPIMGYSALNTGLALLPFALGAAAGSAFLGPSLMRGVRPRFLITTAIVVEAWSPDVAGAIILAVHVNALVFAGQPRVHCSG